MNQAWNSRIDTMDNRQLQGGFTLVELLVAMAMFVMVLGAIVGIFTNFSNRYTTQNVTADIQQALRAAGDYMAREIRMAGFTPLDDEDFGITESQIRTLGFTVDWDADGKVDASHGGAIPHESDIIEYNYIATDRSLRRITGKGTASFSSQTLLGGADDDMKVTGLTFNYLDSSNNSTSSKSDIRTVIITLTAQAPAGREGLLERSYVTRVRCRNLGL